MGGGFWQIFLQAKIIGIVCNVNQRYRYSVFALTNFKHLCNFYDYYLFVINFVFYFSSDDSLFMTVYSEGLGEILLCHIFNIA